MPQPNRAARPEARAGKAIFYINLVPGNRDARRIALRSAPSGDAARSAAARGLARGNRSRCLVDSAGRMECLRLVRLSLHRQAEPARQRHAVMRSLSSDSRARSRYTAQFRLRHTGQLPGRLGALRLGISAATVTQASLKATVSSAEIPPPRTFRGAQRMHTLHITLSGRPSAGEPRVRPKSGVGRSP